MLKLLAYQIQQLGGGRKPPIWRIGITGKTTLALSVSAKTRQKHQPRFIELARVGGLGWKERNSMVKTLLLIRRSTWGLDDCLGRHNGAQSKHPFSLSRHCFEMEARKGSLALPLCCLHNLIEWCTVKRCPRCRKLPDIVG